MINQTCFVCNKPDNDGGFIGETNKWICNICDNEISKEEYEKIKVESSRVNV
ncbi:hypothetical protein KM915_21045 [Cytobacillus oceanisediminis]|uniref:hypothetical protein n=1 Tax=Cytobacillus oceanisediminis TaxID=665099 RepID=UPI001C24F30A|nr:hypothetical protein [Cytobacillus oceanisediminis]MBU8732539.1 hypothetical protein [Cytobacillus oceanisediminis]